MYAFHQYYKDGSNGSMDCRWFAAFYLLMKLGFSVLIAITVGGIFCHFHHSLCGSCDCCTTLQERVRELQYTGHGHNVTPGPLAGEYHVPQCSSFGEQTLWEIHILACRVSWTLPSGLLVHGDSALAIPSRILGIQNPHSGCLYT